MEETFCFDELVDRRNTNCIKWDSIPHTDKRFASDEIIPMWVADMDFRSPPALLNKMKKALDHGVFGYTVLPERAWQSVAEWTRRRYLWATKTEWMSYTPGVITGLNIAIQTFTRPGEKIVIQPPVYPPFHNSVVSNGRQLVYNPLTRDEKGVFRFDLEQLMSVIDKNTKMLVICNPHNPTGRAWSRDELDSLAQIALEKDLLVFSDEIHADLLLEESPHIPFASLSPEIAERTITGIAPSKTFNIAGLKASVIISSNEKLKNAFDAAQAKTFGLYDANTFAVIAIQSAYTEGEKWLDDLLVYIKKNRDLAFEHMTRNIPGILVSKPEATFLYWLDFSRLELKHEEIVKVLYEKARVILNDGRSFGPGGESCFRLNFGCPQSVLLEGLDRIAEALDYSRKK